MSLQNIGQEATERKIIKDKCSLEKIIQLVPYKTLSDTSFIVRGTSFHKCRRTAPIIPLV